MRRGGNFLYRRRQSAFAVLYRLYNHCSAIGYKMDKAVMKYSEPRFTKDLDIFIATDQDKQKVCTQP